MSKELPLFTRNAFSHYRLTGDKKIRLNDFDPGDTKLLPDKDEAKERSHDLTSRLSELQELLFAQHKHKLLIVFQAMDTAGKDGTIEHVFEGVNPQGVKVAYFKTPTSEELDHDYLWRIHQQTPRKGEITIFNRSHYEDVLVVRVHDLVPKQVWQKRFDHINAFEKLLTDEGVTILKFFLHISKDEQKKRLEDRRDDPKEQWKFRVEDLSERKLWPEYMKAYEDVLNRTSTPFAPWHIIPSNKKWYRNLIVASVITETLGNLKMKYPKAQKDIAKVVIT